METFSFIKYRNPIYFIPYYQVTGSIKLTYCGNNIRLILFQSYSQDSDHGPVFPYLLRVVALKQTRCRAGVEYWRLSWVWSMLASKDKQVMMVLLPADGPQAGRRAGERATGGPLIGCLVHKWRPDRGGDDSLNYGK